MQIKLISLAAGTSISATIWARACEGFVISAGSMGINYPVYEFRKPEDPLRQKFLIREADRYNIDLSTHQPCEAKQTCYQLRVRAEIIFLLILQWAHASGHCFCFQ